MKKGNIFVIIINHDAIIFVANFIRFLYYFIRYVIGNSKLPNYIVRFLQYFYNNNIDINKYMGEKF